MATLLLTAVGTIVGGPLGGAIGALVGRQVDAAIIGGRTSEGPRLKELSVQTSSYGAPLPLHFGRMRAAGTVIWSTELIEHREKQGGGKGRPSVTTYSYTASFAVALASRPIAGIGRVWADGNLLRGAAGDLKVGGVMRVHTGHGDQQVDPLLVQAEGAALCPAFRHTAYVVFEDLELADFGNRLPSLTFEILADESGTSLDGMIAEIAPEAVPVGLSRGLAGFSIDRGTAADVLGTLSQAYPLACTARGETLVIADAQASPVGGVPVLPEAAGTRDDSEAGHQTGISTRRDAQPRARLCGLRYYDIDRDYQPGLQRGRGRAEPGELAVIDLPAALSATEARIIADSASRRTVRPAETARYRVAQLGMDFAPGSLVELPGRAGTWRVDQWEWQADGVALQLTRMPVEITAGTASSDPGRINAPPDLALEATRLVAIELPWDGSGSGDRAALFAAASAPSAGWPGAALFVARSDGSLVSIGSTGRRRAILGTAIGILPTASPLLLDRVSVVDVQLPSDLELGDAGFVQLSEGVNRALIGEEVIQFGSAQPLGGGIWRLSSLLRGRGGTELAVGNHVAGEPFVLIDDALVPLDPLVVGDATVASIVASGLGDAGPVTSPIHGAGITTRPLSPVHGILRRDSAGGATLGWRRRARGAWLWPNFVDAPLNEQAELWEIALTLAGSVLATWQTNVPQLILDAGLMSEAASASRFEIRQVGSFSRSVPLIVPVVP